MMRKLNFLLVPSSIILLFPIIIIIGGIKTKRLSEYVGNYEPLDYDADLVHESHVRVQRSRRTVLDNQDESISEPELHLNFRAYQRDFKLRLKVDNNGVFNPDLRIDDSFHLVAGHLEGEPGSQVFGSLRNGVFDGMIITPTETFYVERSTKYQKLPNKSSLHSVIYSERDVVDQPGKGCGMSDGVKEWMEQIQNSAVEVEDPSWKPFHDGGAGVTSTSSTDHNRIRRASRSASSLSSTTTCTLSIQTDPLLWRHISARENTTSENKIRAEILSLVAQHVKAANFIYSRTFFAGKENYRGIHFQVQRVKIDTDRTCQPGYNKGGDPNPFCDPTLNATSFLDIHSLQDHEAFCLAYVFTYRDFSGTTGLAWEATRGGGSGDGVAGGVCEKFKTYTEYGDDGIYLSRKRSLNTGFITLQNFNSSLPPHLSQLSFAHQLGHSFGSPHDYPKSCRSGGTSGNFLMFPGSTSGDRPNHSKFSDCSIRNISLVLDARHDEDSSRSCFIATNSSGAFCGNEIVEEGEECDCGFNHEECEDRCCYPRQLSSADLEGNPEAAGCRRRPEVRCSPSEGPCCSTSSCNYISNNGTSATQCRPEGECSFPSFCNGMGARCPTPAPRPELTPCNGGTQVCQNGECRGSICLKYGLEECFLLATSDGNNDLEARRKLCELACLDKNGTCRATSELKLEGLPPGGLRLRPGAPCDNFRGTCDATFKCRVVVDEEEGPMTHLKGVLFGKQKAHNKSDSVIGADVKKVDNLTTKKFQS